MRPTLIAKLIACLCLAISASLHLQAQNTATTIGAEAMPFNDYMAFKADESMFYYSDIGYQTSHEAVLLAANAMPGGSMMYHTLDHPVYIVGVGDSVFIDDDLSELEAHFEGDDIQTQTSYEVTINSPANAANANLSLFVLQLEQDQSEGRLMYVGGVGIAIIQDVDPSTFQGIQIPNGQVFVIETVTTESNAGDCSGGGNHALKIKW